MRYMVYQLEQGESGTPHYQGYVYFKYQRRRTSVTSALPGCHVTIARHSAKVNKKYCTKEPRLAEPKEYGTMPEQRVANSKDKPTAADAVEIATTEGLLAVRDKMPGMYLRYRKRLQDVVYDDLVRKRKRKGWMKPTIEVYYGPSRTGKTRHCFTKYPDLYTVASHTGGKLWMDGYEGEDVILFDDFMGGIPFRLLLQITGGYPVQLEYKGGHVMLLATTILFTSNKHPECWYQKAIEAGLDQAPWLARLEEFGRVELFDSSRVSTD